MHPANWVHEEHRYIVGVDSYTDCVLKGYIAAPYQAAESFSSLAQFLLKMEEFLNRTQKPQAYTALRQFAETLPEDPPLEQSALRSVIASFELKILFRQHTSWQGALTWRERKQEYSFRSVLEMIILLDSALRSMEGSGAA